MDIIASLQRAAPVLQLERPLVFFDLETTGLDTKTDQIVQLAFVKLHTDSTVSAADSSGRTEACPVHTLCIRCEGIYITLSSKTHDWHAFPKLCTFQPEACNSSCSLLAANLHSLRRSCSISATPQANSHYLISTPRSKEASILCVSTCRACACRLNSHMWRCSKEVMST